jgi:hypothetical protein
MAEIQTKKIAVKENTFSFKEIALCMYLLLFFLSFSKEFSGKKGKHFIKLLSELRGITFNKQASLRT